MPFATYASNETDQVLSVPDIVAFWDFSETSGSAISKAPEATVLTEQGPSVPRVAEGPFGRAADFRNGSSYFSVAHAVAPELNIHDGKVKKFMTVVAWIKPTISKGFIAGKWAEGNLPRNSPGDRQYGLFIGLDGDPKVVGHVSQTGDNSPGFPFNNDKSFSGQNVPIDEWSCVAFTYDGTNIRSYFNGVFQANGTKNPYAYTAGAGDNGSDFTVARNQYNGQMRNEFRGLIGGVAVFERKLTEAELLNLASIGVSQTAAPVFSPSAGTYSNNQSVTISTGTSGASIRYTADGSEPTPVTGLLYTVPVAITGTTTLKAIAFSSGFEESTVTTGTFTLQAAPPVFSTPVPGSYPATETQNVTISTVSSGASIRYTTDGSEPSDTLGTIYTGPITVTSSATVKAVAYKAGYQNSNVVSGIYTITNNLNPILNDTFSDGGRTNGADLLDSQWYFMSNTAPTTGGVVGGALKLEVTSGTLNPHAITTFPSQTLAVGQTITLSFDFKSLGSGTSTANATGIRFGLYNSGGTNLTGDDAGPAPGTVFQNDLGYSVFAPHQQTGDATLYYRPANTTNNTFQLQAAANIAANAVTTGSVGTATNSSNTYQASLAITRLNATQFNVAVNYAGTTFNQNYTPAAVTEIFDTLAVFAIAGANQAFTLDNVRVSVVTPPPPNTLVTWRSLQGLAADGSQDLLNPSGDGVANLMKYALNLAPNAGDLALSNNRPLANPSGTTVAELTGLPLQALNGTPSAVFTYIRRKVSTSPGVTHSVLWSDGLASWAANPSAIEMTLSLDATYERVTLTDSFTRTQKPTRFIRLNVERNP